MKSDICLCKATREDHEKANVALAEALKGKVIAAMPIACATFRLDRKATWHAERGNPPKHYITRITGCRVCGLGGVMWQKDAHEKMQHVGCPGPKS